MPHETKVQIKIHLVRAYRFAWGRATPETVAKLLLQASENAYEQHGKGVE